MRALEVIGAMVRSRLLWSLLGCVIGLVLGGLVVWAWARADSQDRSIPNSDPGGPVGELKATERRWTAADATSSEGPNPAAFVWLSPAEPAGGGARCCELPSLSTVATFPRYGSGRVGDYSYFFGDTEGRQAAFSSDPGLHVLEPLLYTGARAEIPLAESGCFSSDGQYLACPAEYELRVYKLRDRLERAPSGKLQPVASIDAPEPYQILWPAGSNVIIVRPTRVVYTPDSTPEHRVVQGWFGCALYAFDGTHLTRVLERPDAVAAAASVNGHAVIVSKTRDSSLFRVEWVHLAPGTRTRRLPVGLGAMPEGVAIAGNTLLFTTSILHPDKSGRLWGTQLTGWDREKAEIRFRLKIPTYLNLYPQELLPGYALAEVAPHGLKQHHPDVVCLDCSPEWPRVVGRVRKAFLDGA